MTEADVVIAGAGPAGLAAAHAASRAGRSVLVLDGAEGDSHGSGLTLWPNAFAALDRLGLRPVVEEAGLRADGLLIGSPAARRLMRLDAGEMSRWCGGNGLTLTRGALLDRLTSSLPDHVTVLREHVVGLRDGRERTRVITSGGTHLAGVVVGADGAGSVVRRLLRGPGDEPRKLGMTVVRGLSSLTTGPRPAEMRMGRGRQFGIFALPVGTYWFAAYRSEPAGQARVTAAAARARVRELFGTWHEPVSDLLTATTDDSLAVHEVIDRPPPGSVWGRGRTTLAGDAAHLAAPTLGQGTCHAFEDAAVLGEVLARELSPAALRAYESRRTARSAAMVRSAHTAAVTGRWDGGFSCALRNAAMWSVPARVQARQLRLSFTFAV